MRDPPITGLLPQCPQLGLSQAKARSQQLSPVSHVSGRNPRIWAIIYCLPGALAGSWIRSGGGTVSSSTVLWDEVGVEAGDGSPMVASPVAPQCLLSALS